MSFSVWFAPEVVAQLEAIETFITETGTAQAAIDFVDAIVSHCERLQTFPERGIRRDDVMPGLRTTHYHGNTIIAFVVDSQAKTVSIVGVYYGGRDINALLQTL